MANYTNCRLVVRGPAARIDELMAFVRGNPEPVSFPRRDADINELKAQLSKLTGHQSIAAMEGGLELAAREGIDVGETPSEGMKLWLAVHAADQDLGAIERNFAFSLNRLLPIPLAILMENDETIRGWTSRNWGDKWCELDRIVAFEDDGAARRDYVFTTPWTPTIAPMVALMERFEDLDIVYLWAEKGNDLAGIAFRDVGGEVEVVHTPYNEVSADIRVDDDGEPFEEDEDDPVTDAEVMEYLSEVHLANGKISIDRYDGVELF